MATEVDRSYKFQRNPRVNGKPGLRPGPETPVREESSSGGSQRWKIYEGTKEDGYRLALLAKSEHQPVITRGDYGGFRVHAGQVAEMLFGRDFKDPNRDRPEFLVEAHVEKAVGYDSVLHFGEEEGHIDTLTAIGGDVSIWTPLTKWDLQTSRRVRDNVTKYVDKLVVTNDARIFINGVRMKSLTEEWTEPEVPEVVNGSAWDPEAFAARMRAVKTTVDAMPETVPAGFGSPVIEPVSIRELFLEKEYLPFYEYQYGGSTFEIIQYQDAPANVKVTELGERLVIRGDGIKSLSLGKKYEGTAEKPLTFEVTDASTIYLKEGHTVHIRGKVGRVLGNNGNVVIEEGAAVEEISDGLTVRREIAEMVEEPVRAARPMSTDLVLVRRDGTGDSQWTSIADLEARSEAAAAQLRNLRGEKTEVVEEVPPTGKVYSEAELTLKINVLDELLAGLGEWNPTEDTMQTGLSDEVIGARIRAKSIYHNAMAKAHVSGDSVKAAFAELETKYKEEAAARARPKV